ncbi:MAG: hypothetical protein CM15mP120_15580 [Pseudomonadota bacterium]|nr:MAG: hypothetical protein CM15mP120_15580 [Pseudomonadota bacterium]
MVFIPRCAVLCGASTNRRYRQCGVAHVGAGVKVAKGYGASDVDGMVGAGKHFVHYYVRGGDYVNCVCVVEKSGWQVESWTERGDLVELQQDFAGWHPHVVELINQADASELFKWALFDRPPMTQWGKGASRYWATRPTLPFMAQGAAMAIEDAAVLALYGPDPTRCRGDALRRSASKASAGIQRGSRRNAKVFPLVGIAAWAAIRAAGRAGQYHG